MHLSHESIDTKLTELLRDKPRGTAADLSEFAVAYWDGRRVVFAFLDEHEHTTLDEEFDLTDYLLDQWEPELAAWFAEPHYSMRTEVLREGLNNSFSA